MNIENNIKYIGVNDYDISLFEALFKVENGMSYNSYIILDKKIAIMDTVDAHFTQEWLDNISNHLNGRIPEFLIVQHMEPDHSASIYHFMQKYPNTKIVAHPRAFFMLEQFFKTDYTQNQYPVKDGDTLHLGRYTLSFFEAPLVHWPEVIMTYVNESKVLFSADAFGKFGTIGTNEPWIDEARRYYFGIVGKFGIQVTNVLKKLSSLEINTICPLHGPILCDNIPYYINLYKTWASYKTEKKGILIAYTSIYGNTENVVHALQNLLQKETSEDIIIRNLTKCDIYEALANAFSYEKLILATTTYNGTVFPVMEDFIRHLTQRNFQNRKIGFIENGSWSPMAANNMKAMFSKSKNLIFYDTTVTIRSALSPESLNQLSALVNEICN